MLMLYNALQPDGILNAQANLSLHVTIDDSYKLVKDSDFWLCEHLIGQLSAIFD